MCVFSVILDASDAAEGIYRFPSPPLPPASNGFVCPVNAACLLSTFWKRPERNLGLSEMRGDAVTDGLRILGPTRPSSLPVSDWVPVFVGETHEEKLISCLSVGSESESRVHSRMVTGEL